MEFVPQKLVSFAITFLPEISATKLKIPAHISVLQKSITLMDKYKNYWQVKVRKVDGQLHLLEGWAKFVIDSSIAMMDVLAFNYSASGFIDVNIFGANGEIKAGVGYHKQVSENEDDSEEGFIELTPQHDRKRKGRMENEPRVDSKTYTATNSENVYQKRRNIVWRGNKIITSRSAPRPNILSSATKMPLLQIKEMDNGVKEIVYESSDKDSNYTDEINGLEKSRKFKLQGRNDSVKITKPIKRARVKDIGQKLFESGVISKPEGRYFITKMNRMNDLYIPKSILKDKNIFLPKMMVLVDPSGDKYDAKLIPWSGGRKVYKGCSSLYEKNHLSRNDFCICEFGEGNQSGFLYINILRRVRS